MKKGASSYEVCPSVRHPESDSRPSCSSTGKLSLQWPTSPPCNMSGSGRLAGDDPAKPSCTAPRECTSSGPFHVDPPSNSRSRPACLSPPKYFVECYLQCRPK